MFHLGPLFLVAVGVGVVGVHQMIEGARAIRRADFTSMSSHHLIGVTLLTLSALATAYDIGDVTYLLMQPPFLIGALGPYLAKHEGSALRFLRPFVSWWNLSFSIGANTTLVVTGFLFGWIPGFYSAVQVVGAGIVSSGLCVADNRRQAKLLVLTSGRALLCLASFLKFWPTFSNAAALIWTILMAWSVFEGLRQWLAVRAEESKPA